MGGVPSKLTTSTMAAATQMAKSTAVTDTFHAMLMLDPRPSDRSTIPPHGPTELSRSSLAGATLRLCLCLRQLFFVNSLRGRDSSGSNRGC